MGARYTADLMANVDGGAREGTAFLGNLDLTLRLDLEELLGWNDLTVFVYALGTHGESASALAGDAQGVDNIEAPETVRLYEAWIEKDFVSSAAGFSLLVGLYDVNSEFDVVEEAGAFLHSSFGIGAELGLSGLSGPSIFPVTSLGTRLKWRPGPATYVMASVLDGVPGDPGNPEATAIRISRGDGALAIVEVGHFFGALSGGGGARAGRRRTRLEGAGRGHVPEDARGKVALGLWHYTRRFAAPGGDDRGAMRRGRPGVYALGEGTVRAERDPSQGLALFARAGWADPRVHRFELYAGGGLVYTGLLPGRPADEFGLGVAAARNGDVFRESEAAAGRPVTPFEIALELTYRAQVTSWLALQPDLQVVFNPDTEPDRPGATLVGVRGEIGF